MRSPPHLPFITAVRIAIISGSVREESYRDDHASWGGSFRDQGRADGN